jgi:alcohol dehydrogenase YqhD (iron-dependent ADH family)
MLPSAAERLGLFMKNFTYSIPTTVHFGEGQIKKLGAEIAKELCALRA